MKLDWRGKVVSEELELGGDLGDGLNDVVSLGVINSRQFGQLMLHLLIQGTAGRAG